MRCTIKTLYLIRHAKSSWKDIDASDFERGLTKKGKKSIETIGSYLKLRGVCPDIILSSCALRAQETADCLAKKLEFDGKINYMQELYFTDTETLKQIVMLQENDADTIFVIGHNPQITDMANSLIDEHISKIPTMGVVATNFDIEQWSDLGNVKGTMDFFISPKQFQYYIPNQIRAILNKEV
ncbi:phosphoglycerate/bisphosphoglycerate mutase [Sulfurovum sp. NBC37-1]|nr:phosphoglycerate/bisphosphoglycerate mutase [Sulfurovum sp. NBC37-1]